MGVGSDGIDLLMGHGLAKMEPTYENGDSVSQSLNRCRFLKARVPFDPAIPGLHTVCWDC